MGRRAVRGSGLGLVVVVGLLGACSEGGEPETGIRSVEQRVVVGTYQRRLGSTTGVRNGWDSALTSSTALLPMPDFFGPAGANQGAIEVMDPSDWSFVTRIVAPDGAAGDHFGESVALGRDGIRLIALIGAPDADVGGVTDQGAAYIFDPGSGTWRQRAKLTVPTTEKIGRTVALSGTVALLGASTEDVGGNVNQGAAYVFTGTGTSWALEATLTASDGAALDAFATAVEVDGATAVVGAPNAASGQGAAYVFVRNGTVWTEEGKLVASDGAAPDSFGRALAVQGDTIVVGAPLAGVGGQAGRGAAYVFVRSGTVWSEQAKLIAAAGLANDNLGDAVALDGNLALVAATGDDVFSSASQGSVFAYLRRGTAWSEETSVTQYGTTSQFGHALALLGSVAMIGTIRDFTYIYDFGLARGDACDGTSPCASGGFCVDGVCCDRACTGECEACSVSLGATADGTCTVASAGTPAAPACGNAATCNGVSGACPKDDGVACAAASECVSGFCADGVCCASACDQPCEACGEASSRGTCVAVSGDPRVSPTGPTRTACNGSGACGGACNGVERSACSYPDPSTECAPAGCTGEALVEAAYCDGAGACAPAASTSCAPFGCDPVAPACRTSCAGNAECAAGATCVSSSCTVTASGGTGGGAGAGGAGGAGGGAGAGATGGTAAGGTSSGGAAGGGASGAGGTGAAASGGTSGSGGSGASATGGTGGAGGTTGSGGSLPGTGGTSPDGGGGEAGGVAASDDGGCGCRAAGSRRLRASAALMLALAWLGSARPRRHRRQAATPDVR